jgi:hypothetical protein
VAEVNPERGEAIARSIPYEDERFWALANVVRVTTAANPERAFWLAVEIESAARSIEDISKRTEH